MKRKIILMLVLTLQAGIAGARQWPMVVAHRGCWLGTEVPENSIEAVRMAARFGYPALECDVHYTKDSVMVLMHDFTDMRRCIRRKTDNSRVETPQPLSSLTFRELREDYVLASDNPAFREPVPTLEELLLACKEHHVMPMLHSDIYESYELAERMFHGKWVAFAGSQENLKRCRQISDCMILINVNDETAEEAMEKLREIGGKCGVSTMNYRLETSSFCHTLREKGYEVQSSIFPTPHDLLSTRNGASIVLSDFCYLPNSYKNRQKSILSEKERWQKASRLTDRGRAQSMGLTCWKSSIEDIWKLNLRVEDAMCLSAKPTEQTASGCASSDNSRR
ncbi:MAG: hypothetical protein IJ196_03155 [Prevotella sp.]|nr:hypothetical protein [Prevotella sp.]